MQNIKVESLLGKKCWELEKFWCWLDIAEQLEQYFYGLYRMV